MTYFGMSLGLFEGKAEGDSPSNVGLIEIDGAIETVGLLDMLGSMDNDGLDVLGLLDSLGADDLRHKSARCSLNICGT